MAELTHKERLQPSLLDRLTDDEPEKTQESRNQRVLSPSKLRESVRRDLAWLFNTTNLMSMRPEIADYPHLPKSVVNFGLPDLAGHTANSIEIPVLERTIREAIWDFEPRLVKNSVKVTILLDEDEMSHNTMSFTVEAVLWAQPLPLRLFLRSQIDLETGVVAVDELRE
jgi:type VI secretion system protein ImpF